MINLLCICLGLCALGLTSSAEDDLAKKDALIVVNKADSLENQKASKNHKEDSKNFKEELTDEVFYPTKDWQTIKPGQAIPQGLHVRINLQTHEKEAKLMDGDDGLKYWKEGERSGIVNSKHKYFTHDELKDALKALKSDENSGFDKDEKPKKKFRSINELKTEFSKLNVNFKTDVEILKEFINKFQADNITNEEQEKILHDLEYYLHQYDNAQDFVKLGGLTLLMQALNSSQDNIRREAAFALGSAMQGNPQVKIAAFESGALQQLLRMLALEENDIIQSRTLYALSCLMRHFPFVQERFIQLGGFSTLSKVFKQPQASKVVVKIITLLNDLITEQHLVSEHSLDGDTNKEKLHQYNRIRLEDAILEHGWCQTVPQLLIAKDHDAREKILQAMFSLVKICQSYFLQRLPQLNSLQAEYRELIELEKQSNDSLDFFSSLYSLIENLVQKLNTVKDEL